MATSNTTLFDLYFEYVKDTESPLIFHRWSLIASVSAFLGRRFYLPFGTTRIFPTSYVMLVGNPGTRKSSAIKTAKKILAGSGYETFSAEKTTKEKFLLDLEGLPETYGDYNGNQSKRTSRGGSAKSEMLTADDILRNLDLGTDGGISDRTPREVFICADEFNEFAGSGNLDFLSLLGSLWDWDDESTTYKHRLKNSKSLAIYQPTISILGGNTHTGFQEAFPIQAIGQGFMSRLLLIHGEPSGRKIAFPTKPPEQLADSIKEYFGRIASTVEGEATIAVAAKQALDMIYRSWHEIDDFRFKHYSTRRFTHLLKLTLIVTAMRCSTVVDMQDVLLANTILTHAESVMPKALGEFGKSRNSEATQNVMSALYEAKKPLTFEDLWKVVSRDLDKREQLTDILSGLLQSGKIQPPDKSGGKFAGFLALQKPMNSKALYVDFSLIREMEGKR
jgi:hypothetical protein